MMNRIFATACLLAMISVGVLGQDTAPQASGSKAQAPEHAQAPNKSRPARRQSSLRHKRVPVKMAAPPATAPTPAAAPVNPPVAPQVAPPVPATLMNQPPVSPTVTLQNGLLTIDAPNCLLGDVLNQVSKATGAVLEGATPGERIAVRLGPGDPRQVIAALLQGTPYDYLILGSQERPDQVTRIVLTPASAAPGTPGAPPPAIGQPQPPAEPPAEEGTVISGTVIEGEQPQQPQVQPPQPQPPQPPQPQAPPNSPEALFQQLQQRGQQPQQQPPQQ